MPTYDYECRDCKKSFEQFQPITAKPLKKCPHCGGRVNRLIGAGGGVIFKGSGFYQTDYRSENYKKKQKEEGQPVSCKKSPTGTCPSGGCKGADA